MKAPDRITRLPEPARARVRAIVLLAGVCFLAGPSVAQATIAAPGSASTQQTATTEHTGGTLESAAAKAGNTGRAVAMSLIGLAFAVAATVLAFRRDFKEAAGVFAVGIMSVLLATPAGVSLLRDTVASLFGSRDDRDPLLPARVRPRAADLPHRPAAAEPGGVPVRGRRVLPRDPGGDLIRAGCRSLERWPAGCRGTCATCAAGRERSRAERDPRRRADPSTWPRTRCAPPGGSAGRWACALAGRSRGGGRPLAPGGDPVLPDGSDSRMRRLRYTGPGAVLVMAVAHERAGRRARCCRRRWPRRSRFAAARAWRLDRRAPVLEVGANAAAREGDRGADGEPDEDADRVRVRQLRVRRGSRRLLGCLRADGVARTRGSAKTASAGGCVALLGALGGARGRPTDPACRRALGRRALRARGRPRWRSRSRRRRAPCAASGATFRSSAAALRRSARETGGVPARQPARARARRRRVMSPGPPSSIRASGRRRSPARAVAARSAPAEGRELERARVRADQAHARLADFLPVARRAASSCSGSCAARSAAASASRRSTACTSRGRWSSSATARRCWRRSRATSCAGWTGYVEHRGGCCDRVGARRQLAGACSSLGALPERARFPGARGRADVRAGREPPVRRRPLAERPLPAERARAAHRPPPDPGRRPDRARRVRRRAGRLRPRLRAHAGGARPALLPAGVEPAAAAAGDARDRRRRRATRRSSRSASRCAGARTARSGCTGRSATSCALFVAAAAGAAHAASPGYDDTLTHRAGRGDDADRHARGRARGAGFYLGHTLSGSRQPGQVQPQRGLGRRPQHDDPQRRRARLGQDDARPEAPVRGVPAGRAGDRLRPQGRPPVPPAGGGRAARRDASRCGPIPRCAVCSIRCGSRRSTCARTRRCRSCATCCRRGRSRRGRRRSSRAVDRVARRSREPDVPRGRARAARRRRRPTPGGQTLAVYARSGLTQLGFADPDVTAAGGRATRQVTYLPIRDLPGPEPGMRALGVLAGRAGGRADRAPDRDVRDAADGRRARAAEAVLVRRGLAAARRPGRAACCWRRCSGWGARELAVPIISTQLVTDALVGERESLENLIGATFVFGMRSEAEAGRALALLGLDPEDRQPAAEPARVGRGAMPVARPPRPRRGDPGRGRRARAAARVLDDPARVAARQRRQRRSRALDAGVLVAIASDPTGSAGWHRHLRWSTQRRCWGGSAALGRSGSAATAPPRAGDSGRRSAALLAVTARGKAPRREPRAHRAGAAGRVGEEEASASARPGEADPLVEQRLGSPFCRDVARAPDSRERRSATAGSRASWRRRPRPATTGSTCTSTRACSASATAACSAGPGPGRAAALDGAGVACARA